MTYGPIQPESSCICGDLHLFFAKRCGCYGQISHLCNGVGLICHSCWNSLHILSDAWWHIMFVCSASLTSESPQGPKVVSSAEVWGQPGPPILKLTPLSLITRNIRCVCLRTKRVSEWPLVWLRFGLLTVVMDLPWLMMLQNMSTMNTVNRL